MLSVIAVLAAAFVLLPGAEAQKVLNPGAFSIAPLGGTFSIRNTAIDLSPRPLPQCSDGIDNNGNGFVDLADGGCSNLGAPPGVTRGQDDSELAQGYQPKVDVSISGSIDAQGNVTVPPSGIVFPPAFIGIDDPGTPNLFVPYKVTYVIRADVITTETAVGSLNPLTGDAVLRPKVKVVLQGSAFNVTLGYNCSIGTNAAPITLNLTTGASGGLTGTRYSSSTGAARFVENSFAVPGASGCGEFNQLNDIINQQLGIPSPAGLNNAIIDGQTSPILGKGVVAKITTTPSLLSAPAPFTVDFSGATSTAKAPASYRWDFPDGTSSTSVTATKTFTTVGTQTVKLTVTDADGDVSTVTKNVAVTPGSTPVPVPVPAVAGVSPSSGPTTGGTSVTITGTDLSGASGVSFGGVAATGVTVVNGSTVTAVSPAGSAGTVDVRVTTPGGQSPVSAGDKFAYQAPVVPVPANTDRGSVDVAGSVTYRNSGASTGGGVSVVRDSLGLVSAGGTLDLPGKNGGTARLTVGLQRFWVFQFWTGQVSIDDPGASVSVSAPVFGSVPSVPGVNAVGSTLSWFYFGQFPDLIRPYTLTWSVDDAV